MKSLKKSINPVHFIGNASWWNVSFSLCQYTLIIKTFLYVFKCIRKNMFLFSHTSCRVTPVSALKTMPISLKLAYFENYWCIFICSLKLSLNIYHALVFFCKSRICKIISAMCALFSESIYSFFYNHFCTNIRTFMFFFSKL